MYYMNATKTVDCGRDDRSHVETLQQWVLRESKEIEQIKSRDKCTVGISHRIPNAEAISSLQLQG